MRRQLSLVTALALSFILFSQTLAWPQGGRRGGVTRDSRSIGWNTTLIGNATQAEYKINISDKLKVTIWKNPDLSGELIVNPDGSIFMPLIGRVDAAGLTLEELRSSIKEKLSKYVRYPDVTVVLISSSGRRVVVLGEVGDPGIYSYEGAIDIVSAIALAGDFLETAKRESVIVISDNMTDNPTVRRINVFKSYYRGAAGKEFLLKNDDVVYVPKTFIADWNKTVADLQPTISTIFNGNFMTTRSNLKTLWYNRDRPAPNAPYN